MQSVKCSQCGLVQFSIEENCKRCRASLSNAEAMKSHASSASNAPSLINCPACKAQVSNQAVSCPQCGQPFRESQPQVVYQTAQQRVWSPGVAAVLSIIPGLGQLYKGQIFAAIGWFIVIPIGYSFFILPGVALHVLCIVSALSGDPMKQGG